MLARFLNCYFNKNISQNITKSKPKCLLCNLKRYEHTEYCEMHWRNITKYCLYRI